jgi:peptide deformylase
VIPFLNSTLKVLSFAVPSERKILKTVSNKITKRQASTKSYTKLVSYMIQTMLEYGGVGLAAPQVGLPFRLIVAKHLYKDNVVRVVFNPKIVVNTEQTQVSTERCLSVPGLEVITERPFSITVTGKTLDWKDFEETMQYEDAAIFSHENDHLDGILLTDKIGSLQRKLYEERAKKARKKAIRQAKSEIRRGLRK